MAKKTVSKKSIQTAYQDYLLEHGKKPETVRVFTKFLGIEDEAFYKYYGSLDTIETTIWEDYYIMTLNTIHKDPEFEEMTPREKHLSFLYTMIEIIRPDRSYILFKLANKKLGDLPKELKKAQKVITGSESIDWAKTFQFLPERAKETTQAAYKRVLSGHTLSLLFFWVKDDSPESKETDIFIEKSTRTVFDIGELPALDSIIDLSKFFIQKMGFSKSTI